MLSELIAITRRAHREILEVYNSNFIVDAKSDNTLITEADRRAHDVIVEGLAKIDPSIPVLSEEGEIPPFEERRNWDRLWIVDPLDGTREFAKRNDEFTVNIALIEKGKPNLGVVGIPTKDIVYSGDVHDTVALRHNADDVSPISTAQTSDAIRMTTSRHSTTLQNQQIIDYLVSIGRRVQVKPVGSSIKMCDIAEGRADIYVRFGLSHEWDIAAAHSILIAAGGGLYSLDCTQKEYNAAESTLNSAFFACGSNPEEWSNIFALSGVLTNDS